MVSVLCNVLANRLLSERLKCLQICPCAKGIKRNMFEQMFFGFFLPQCAPNCAITSEKTVKLLKQMEHFQHPVL